MCGVTGLWMNCRTRRKPSSVSSLVRTPARWSSRFEREVDEEHSLYRTLKHF